MYLIFFDFQIFLIMAVSRDLTTHYDDLTIFLSNHEIERELTDDQPHSSASHFENILNLDLIPLIFLKARTAKIALEQISIDSPALAFLSTEHIEIKLTTPAKTNDCNHIITPDFITDWNNQPFVLNMTDFSATNNQECLTYINNLLDQNLTNYLIFRLSLNFFDMNLFKNNIFNNISTHNKITLSKDDLIILLHYINITLYTRRQLEAVLTGQATIEESKLTANFTNLVSTFDQTLEQTTLSKSKYLLDLRERKEMLSNHVFTTLNIEHFYSIDLTTTNNSRKALDVKIKTNIHDYIINILEWDLDHPNSDHAKNITSYQKANQNLMKQGLKLQQLVQLQNQKHTNNFNNTIFHTDLLTLKLDNTGAKVRFEIANQSFLPPDETSVQILFGPKTTYTLGGSQSNNNQYNLTIGPLTHTSNCSAQSQLKPQLTNQILAENQRLHGPIRYRKNQYCTITFFLSFVFFCF